MQRLSIKEHTYFTENILKVLSQNRITTLLEFLQEDTEKITVITKLTLPEVLAIREELFIKYSAPLVNGRSLLVKDVISKKYLTTGIYSLDAATGGGLPIGYITEICGLADSGKTQLCFQLAINCIKATDNTVLYIDTKGDFSATVIQKILDACGCTHKEMANILYKMKIVRVWTMDHLIELFKSIKNKSTSIENLNLIIIDSLPCLMLQFLGDNYKIGLAFLNSFVNYCRFLAKEFNLAIVCVNVQTRWVEDTMDFDDADQASKTKESIETRNRCLGKYWQNIPALLLIMEQAQEISTAEVNKYTKINVTSEMKHFITNNKQSFSLDISNKGVT